MRPESTNLNLAVCLYGTSNTNLSALRQHCCNQMSDYNIEFFEHIDENDLYINLWKSCFKKRQHELEIKKDFDTCVAIDLSDDTLSLFSQHSNLLPKLDLYTSNKLYYVRGRYTGGRGVTEVSPQIFFSNSLTFDCACNFGIEYKYLSPVRKKGTLDDKGFYYFLKSLKIKTECTHFGDLKLFEVI